jgi:transcriptional regulator with PAS, ATPase and Fis domain
LEPSQETSGRRDSTEDLFRWQAYFQKSSEPLFFLNRRRRLLFVNHALESLAGITLREVRGLVCQRRFLETGGDTAAALANALAPLPEVLEGKPARVRRSLPGLKNQPRLWFDIAFFPFAGESGLLGILGKMTAVPRLGTIDDSPLPEKIIALRERRAQEFALDQIGSELPAMRRLVEQARLASQTQLPAALVGERGTGKQWLARCIHQQSSRRERTFAAVDCARLPSWALLEIIRGNWEQGGRPFGTLYLREPGCLLREMQEHLCRLLLSWKEEGEKQAAVLAGFVAEPEDEVRAGRLLPQLWCLLSPLVLHVPPLRERLDDLPWFIDKFLERARAANGGAVVALTEDAMGILRRHSWPGNLAELYQVLLAGCARAKKEQLPAEDLPFYLRTGPAPANRSLPLDPLLQDVERRLIVLALQHAKGNKTKAAELLGIWRPRLIRRMHALGIAE